MVLGVKVCKNPKGDSMKQKYNYRNVTGYWSDKPNLILTVKVALGTWDGLADAEDETIFHYMDNEPITVGSSISEGFVITNIEEI